MLDFDEIEGSTLKRISEADDIDELETVRLSVLGKRGVLYTALRSIGSMPPEERKEVALLANNLKKKLITEFSKANQVLTEKKTKETLLRETHDVTLPVDLGSASEGRIHPISKVTQEVIEIFTQMGFSVTEGPDIETDYYNFTALNFPEKHPARKEHDTFFLKTDAHSQSTPEDHTGDHTGPVLLRTHTSPVQIRVMERSTPPIRVITPGRVYRCDSDQTHTPMFHQLEGLVIDKSVNLGTLKWVMLEFCKSFFELPRVHMRFRTAFFPFTEPSMEVDIPCKRSEGSIEFGTGDTWFEVLGCGMVHPSVMRRAGIDPDEYQGFAWGLGLDRMAMLKYGMPDLRDFFGSDLRWLDHYGFHVFS